MNFMQRNCNVYSAKIRCVKDLQTSVYIIYIISLILRKHYTPRAPAREVQRRPQNFGKFRTKNEQQRMYSSKMCHIYVSSSEISVHEISGNLGLKNFAAPQNFRKFRTKKKSFRFSLIFMSCCFPCSGPLRATCWKGAWLVPVFGPKFLEILDQNLARPIQKKLPQGQGVSLGSDWSRARFPPPARLALWRTCIRRLPGYVAGWLCRWLAMAGWVVVGQLCGCLAIWLVGFASGCWLAVWLYGCVAGWLACYVAAYVAGWLCGSLLCSSVAVAGLPTGDMAG